MQALRHAKMPAPAALGVILIFLSAASDSRAASFYTAERIPQLPLPGVNNFAFQLGTSLADNGTVAGFVLGDTPFAWSSLSGIRNLGYTSLGGTQISPDGQYILGTAQINNNFRDSIPVLNGVALSALYDGVPPNGFSGAVNKR